MQSSTMDILCISRNVCCSKNNMLRSLRKGHNTIHPDKVNNCWITVVCWPLTVGECEDWEMMHLKKRKKKRRVTNVTMVLWSPNGCQRRCFNHWIFSLCARAVQVCIQDSYRIFSQAHKDSEWQGALVGIQNHSFIHNSLFYFTAADGQRQCFKHWMTEWPEKSWGIWTTNLRYLGSEDSGRRTTANGWRVVTFTFWAAHAYA